MPAWLINIIVSIVTLVITLTVTLVFNRLTALPAKRKKQREEEKAREDQHKLDDMERDIKIAELKAAVDALPRYREQSLHIQEQLQQADINIIAACEDIKNSVLENQHVLNERLDRLEKREKNSIRAKLLDEYRLFTDETKNPMLAWSEMEHHAFFELINDYEDLNGNDYVHSTVLPAMNALAVIPMSDKYELLKLMNSRKL